MVNKNNSSEEAEKIQVTFNKRQLELIDSYKGIFGNSRAEVVRYIVAHWLFEKESKK
jgi:hypothetical protein